MSISSLTVAKFQFPWAREEERDPRDQKQIVALTAALQASLARETASRQANAELLQRQHTLVLEFEHRFANGLQWITTLLSLQSRTRTPEAAAQLAIAARRVAAFGSVHCCYRRCKSALFWRQIGEGPPGRYAMRRRSGLIPVRAFR